MHLHWLVNKHALIFCCLKAVNIFKILRRIANRNYACVMTFHIYSKKFSSCTLWYTVSGVDWVSFFCVFLTIPWHQRSQNFKTASPDKNNTLKIYTFFNKQSIFDPRPEHCLSFSKTITQKDCLAIV